MILTLDRVTRSVHYLADRQVCGNTLLRWILAVALFLVSLALLRWLRGFLHRRIAWFAKRTATEWDDLAAALVADLKNWFLLFGALWGAAMTLTLSDRWRGYLDRGLVVVVFLQCALVATRVASFFIQQRFAAHEDPETRSATIMVNMLARVAIWSFALLLALDNLGVNISALVAGLGVGGVAIALATQNILGDMFASVSILLDKPFVVGDFIVLEGYLGTVERIGVKTTRLSSLGGERIIVSNTDLLKSRIRNYRQMQQRRVVFSFGVTYEISVEKLEQIPGIVREIITAQANTRFDRAHFSSYGDSALLFEVVYYALTGDYTAYMDTQQAINFALYRRLTELGAEFAYPTQTVHLIEHAKS